MNQVLEVENKSDSESRPAGGFVKGVGIDIQWQNGPLGSGLNRIAPNGAFVESVLRAALARLEYYQTSQFKCKENADAIAHVQLALEILNSRTKRRETQGVEGTHAGN